MITTAWHTSRPILMTADVIGGVWTYALELCRGLAQFQIGVSLAVMGRSLAAEERAAAREIAGLQLFERETKLEWMEDPWSDIERSGEWLRDLEIALKPCLIHLNGFAHGALPWRAPCLIVGHSCVFSWFDAVRHAPPPENWRRYKQAVTVGLRGADAVTAPSHFMLAQLRKHYGGFGAVAPIYNGRAAREFRALEKEPFVLTAGRLWDPAKNIAALAPVAGKITWPIYAAGSANGPDGRNIEFHGLHALGQLDSATLAGWYGRAAIFVLAAYYEPFGLSILEAALAGCALVLGDIPSLREIWRGAALFAAPDDPDAIGAALKRLIASGSLREELSARVRARALEFTPERMTRNYLALYRNLLSTNGQSLPDLGSRAAAEGPA